MEKILIVNTASHERNILKGLLEKHRYTVIEAENGVNALDIIRTRVDLDLVISEIVLPVMDGYSLCSQLKNDEKLRRTLFIFYTATFTKKTDVEYALKLGADDYVIKSKDNLILIKKINKLLKNSEHNKKKVFTTIKHTTESNNQYDHALINRLQERIIELEASNLQVKKELNQHKHLTEKTSAPTENYEDLYNYAPDMFISVDVETSLIKLCNQTLLDELGYLREEIIGKPLFKLYHPNSREEAKKTFEEFVKKGEINDKELCFQKKDGTELEISLNATSVKDKNGKIIMSRSTARNNSKRKQLRNKLIKEKEFTELAIDSQLDTFFVYDPSKGRAIRWNKKFSEISGYSDEEIRGLTMPDSYYSKEDIEKAKTFFEDLSPQSSETIELELICKNGQKIPVEYRISALYDNHFKYIIFVGRDITDRKNNQNNLLESEERFRRIFEGSPLGIALIARSGQLIICNQSCLKIFGATSFEQIEEFNVLNDPRVSDTDKLNLKKGEIVRFEIKYEFEKPVQLKNFNSEKKGTIYLGIQISPIDSSETETTAYLAYINDITIRKHTEEKLIKSERKFRGIFENAGVGIAHVALDGRFIEVNDQFCEISGYSYQEITRLSFQDIAHPEHIETDKDLIKKLLTGEIKDYSIEKRYFKGDGTESWIHLTNSLIWNELGKPDYFISIIKDITSYKKIENERLNLIQNLGEHVKQLNCLYKVNEAIRKHTSIDNLFEEVITFLPPALQQAESTFVKIHFCEKDYLSSNFDRANLKFITNITTRGKKRGTIEIYQIEEHNINWQQSLATEEQNLVNGIAKALGEAVLRIEIQKELRLSKKRYQYLFDNSPVPLWEEDFSELLNFLDELKSQGIENFRTYFDSHPEVLQTCAQKINVLQVNNETLRLHEAKTKSALTGHLDKIFTTKSFEALKEEIIALTLGKNEFQTEAEVRTLDGKPKQIFLNFLINRELKTVLLATIDITSRKQIENALRESEKLFATLFESSPVAILMTKLPSGEIINVNNRWTEVMGYSKSESVGKNIIELGIIDEKTRMGLREELLLNDFLKMKENEVNVKSGEKKTILSSLKLVQLENTQYALISVIDINDRKETEKELIESERKLNTLLGNLPGMAYRCKYDPDWTILYASKGAVGLTGYSPEELTYNKVVSYGSLIHSDDIQLVQNKIEKSIKEGKQFELEYRILCKNKRTRWVWERGVAVETTQDGTIILEGLISDITEEQRVKEELKQSEKRFRTSLDNMLEGCQILDKELRYIYLNDTAVEHSRTTREKLLNNLMKDIYPGVEQTQLYVLLNDCVINNTIHEIENEFVYPDGNKGWFELKIQPIQEGVFILSQDITKRKETQLVLQQNRERLIEAQRIAKMGDFKWNYITGEVDWSEGLYELLGYDVGKTINYDLVYNKMHHPDDIEEVTKWLNDTVMSKSKTLKPLEYRIYKKDKSTIFIRTTGIVDYSKPDFPIVFATIQDITERKRNEERLKRNELFLNTLLNAIPVPIFYKDKNGKYLGFNKAFIVFTGINRSNLIGKSVFEVHPPELAKMYHAKDKELLEKGGTQRFESEIEDISGNRLKVIFNKAAFLDENGKINGLIGTILDITRLKNIENELLKKNKELEFAKIHLEKSERRLKEAHILTKLGGWEFDFGTNTLNWSDETCRIFEISPEEFKGTIETFERFVHPEDKEKVSNAFQEHITTKKSFDIGHRIILQNGKIKYVHEKCQTEFDKKGNAIKSVGTVQDYTEIKQIEHKLLRLNEELELRVEERTSEITKLSEAVRYNPAVVFITSPDGIIQYVNPRFIEQTGYSEKEAIGKTPRILNSGTHPKDFFAHLWETIKGGEVWHGEICNKKKNGEIYWVSASISSIKNKNNEIIHFVSVREDITLRKEMEKQLKIAKEEAEKANRAKSEFLANMSHEIRTPLNAVLGFADLLSQMITDELQMSYLDSIKSSGKSLLTLINDILDLSKIEAGKLELELEYVDLNDLFHEMKTIFSLHRMNNGVEFMVNVESNVPPLLLLDEVRLRQVLINLLSNAFKFTSKGYIHLKATAKKNETNKDTCNLSIEVEDSGIGITKESKSKIFEAFSQQEGQSTKKYGGTGLGLAISQRLVSLMNGKIELKSEVGKGATFRLVFEKIRWTSNKAMKKEHLTVDIETVKFLDSKILIVDDIEDNRKYLAGVLARYNMDVIQAVDGNDALKKLKNEKIDLIITDLLMPNVNGFQLKKQLSQDDNLKDIPIIAASASAMQQNIKRIKEAKFSGFLIKPFQINELLTELIKYLPYENLKTKPIKLQNKKEIITLNVTDWRTFEVRLDDLVSDYLPLKEQQSMKETELFANKCILFGKEFNMPIIVEFGNQLASSVKSFDIELMLALIENFDTIIKDSRELIRANN